MISSRPYLAFPLSFGGSKEAMTLARLAQQSLTAEAELSPKPGLVDRRGNGAHIDLSLEIMRRGALAIEPYFLKMASISRGNHPSQQMREALAMIGRDAESAMLQATGGSNSHKGAIWSLGLLVSSASMQRSADLTAWEITMKAREIALLKDRSAPRLVSHGERVAKEYGIKGARGEACDGFPHVIYVGLPMLRKRRRRGATEHVARIDALLAIMSSLNDTCLLYRGGPEGLETAKDGAFAVLKAGGYESADGKVRFGQLDRKLLQLGVSPGGSADLLAATLFLDALEMQQNIVYADTSLPGEYGTN